MTRSWGGTPLRRLDGNESPAPNPFPLKFAPSDSDSLYWQSDTDGDCAPDETTQDERN